MQVRDLMTTHPTCVSPSETIQHAAQEMKVHNVGALPVCDGERLMGIITDRDIAVECVASGSAPSESFVSEYMTANPITIAADATDDEALRRMTEEQVRRLCVVDEGHLLGIVALGDLAVRLADRAALANALAAISQPVRLSQYATPMPNRA